MDCSMPGFRVHHQLLELAQTHVHWVGDAIQPSHQDITVDFMAYLQHWFFKSNLGRGENVYTLKEVKGTEMGKHTFDQGTKMKIKEIGRGRLLRQTSELIVIKQSSVAWPDHTEEGGGWVCMGCVSLSQQNLVLQQELPQLLADSLLWARERCIENLLLANLSEA